MRKLVVANSSWYLCPILLEDGVKFKLNYDGMFYRVNLFVTPTESEGRIENTFISLLGTFIKPDNLESW